MNKFIGLTGSQIIYKKLLQKGTTITNIYSGGAIMPLIDEFNNKKNSGNIKYFVHTHEQNCSHAATGYAKASGKTGICIVTSGPGLTNTITGMLDATNDSTPLMVISGQVPIKSMGTLAFQECPATDISKSCTKFSYCIKDIEELPVVFDYAYKIANDGKKGAVHLDIPKCIFNKIFTGEKAYRTNFENKTNNNLIRNHQKIYKDLNPTYIKELINLINNSKKPIAYVGQGCNNYKELLTNFINTFNIPITTTLHAQGVYDEDQDLSLKMLGMHGTVYANKAMQESDLIICLGARFDDRTTGNIELFAPKAKEASLKKKGGFIHCNISNSELNKVVETDYPIHSDCGSFLTKLLNNKIDNEIPKRINWLNTIKEWKKNYPLSFQEDSNGKIKTQSVLTALNKKISNNTLITTGVGTHQMMATQFITYKGNRRIISSGSLGVMGAGIPYAIGCKLACPDKDVIVIDGDSSALMTLTDIKTIVENDIDIKIAIINNHTQSMVKEWEKLFYNGRITATTNKINPKFKDVAQAFGMKGLYCKDLDSLPQIINDFIDFKGPILCEFDTIDEICLPLVKPGHALDDMLLENEYKTKFIQLKGEAPC